MSVQMMGQQECMTSCYYVPSIYDAQQGSVQPSPMPMDISLGRATLFI